MFIPFSNGAMIVMTKTLSDEAPAVGIGGLVKLMWEKGKQIHHETKIAAVYSSYHGGSQYGQI